MSMKFYETLSKDFTKLLEFGDEYNTIIEVGMFPQSKSYKTHSSVLCYRCPYLYNELKGIASENAVKIIRKPDLSVEVFNLLVRESSASSKPDLSRSFSTLSTSTSTSDSTGSSYSLSQFFLSPSSFSRIITEKQAALISTWIDNPDLPYTESTNPYNFQLVLRGSNHGFDHKAFWKKCDMLENIVVIIKIHGTDEIIGGYNPIGWNKRESQSRFSRNSGFTITRMSFIFALKDDAIQDSIVSRVKHVSSAIYNGAPSGYGPSFGSSDLNMIGNFKKDKKCFCIHNSYSAYEKAIRDTKESFSVDEYEIFSLH
ncbi:10034_t:CDS:2 [Acaulospora colombiana]|uniref:10034_t:CDS:1 n=1 Tax=Acaulospora colombiana TaxID=27376 RepID=A0ACA9KSA0_9GLOM|nr:10034_t:CDS:2 [Acaulospora colombiana]